MWRAERSETSFEADPVVRITCRHCQRSWGQHGPDGACAPRLAWRIPSTWRLARSVKDQG